LLFHEANCQCYYPLSFTTAANADEPELASQDIRLYTSLLLHDTGEGLADNRPEFQASGREWRTPPLWGGLTETVSGHTRFLHDVVRAVFWWPFSGTVARLKVRVRLLARCPAALYQFLVAQKQSSGCLMLFAQFRFRPSPKIEPST
jgi:CxxC motif-containing protein (DUF1111 family)